jgi:hypothetical protein
VNGLVDLYASFENNLTDLLRGSNFQMFAFLAFYWREKTLPV